MEQREQHEVLAAAACNDGQRGVHRRGAAARDRGEGTEESYQQRCSQQGEDLTDDICQQGDGSQVGTAVLGDEDAR